MALSQVCAGREFSCCPTFARRSLLRFLTIPSERACCAFLLRQTGNGD